MPPRREAYAVVIVGGGIAGASVAYFLAQAGCRDALLLERESDPGLHATGRSAAAWLDYDPDPELARLKRASLAFLSDPPAGFAPRPLLAQDGFLLLGTDAPEPLARRLRDEGARVERWTAAQARARVPALGRTGLDGALWLPRSGRIDVAALLAGYLRGAERGGVELATGVGVTRVRVEGGRCAGVELEAGAIRAPVVVNAAGAWAGALARDADALPIRIAPLRRTMVAFGAGSEVRRWPVVAHSRIGIYVAPGPGGVVASPMDEEPSAPCDAAADPAQEGATARKLEAVAPGLAGAPRLRSWAGLRAFAPDRRPVVGFDPRRPGFFWLAGQGGVGLATSPVLGRTAAEQIVRRAAAGPLGPERFD